MTLLFPVVVRGSDAHAMAQTSAVWSRNVASARDGAERSQSLMVPSEELDEQQPGSRVSSLVRARESEWLLEKGRKSNSPAREQAIVPRFDFDHPAFVASETRHLSPTSTSYTCSGRCGSQSAQVKHVDALVVRAGDEEVRSERDGTDRRGVGCARSSQRLAFVSTYVCSVASVTYRGKRSRVRPTRNRTRKRSPCRLRRRASHRSCSIHSGGSVCIPSNDGVSEVHARIRQRFRTFRSLRASR